ncbi:hypothetical protein EVAR_37440_1 [Eumeta japonica]|uniref:Uncharacterized protein n=1 Tax=Eumeta variegata TaxID=151549 RepID=A0A4C1X6K0_EUMVA|nr:hypothetical protein EVAR_37440_1 [Eumeta japonica]
MTFLPRGKNILLLTVKVEKCDGEGLGDLSRLRPGETGNKSCLNIITHRIRFGMSAHRYNALSPPTRRGRGVPWLSVFFGPLNFIQMRRNTYLYPPRSHSPFRPARRRLVLVYTEIDRAQAQSRGLPGRRVGFHSARNTPRRGNEILIAPPTQEAHFFLLSASKIYRGETARRRLAQWAPSDTARPIAEPVKNGVRNIAPPEPLPVTVRD